MDKGVLMNTSLHSGSPAARGEGKRVVVLGAGGHAKVVCEVLQDTGYEVIGFLDDNATLHGTRVFGLPVLGPNELVTNLKVDGAIVGIGDNAMRQQWFERLVQLGIPLVSAIHPTAVIASDVLLGDGVVLLPNTSLNVSARLGDNIIVNTGGIIGHDCVIESHVHIGPAVTLCGGVCVGIGAFLGAEVVVIPYRSIGANAVVGAGGIVTCDIPERTLAVGLPARVVRTLAPSEKAQDSSHLNNDHLIGSVNN